MKKELALLEFLVTISISISIGAGVLLEYIYGYSWLANIAIIWIWFAFIVYGSALFDQNYILLDSYNKKSKLHIFCFRALNIVNVIILAGCGWFVSCVALALTKIFNHVKINHDRERREKENREEVGDG